MAEFGAPGRVLSYQLGGRPDGAPVLIHHGLVGSDALAPEWDELAAAAGIAVLTVARPGYGESSPVAMTAAADWAALVTPLLDELGWARFDTVGISAGAVYAYALAALLPQRVRRVGICSGVPHVVDPEVLACYSASDQEAYRRYRSAPAEQVAAEMAGFLTALRDQLPAGHRWHAAVADSLRNDAAGPAREARLQIRSWGFAPAEVGAPVRLWHAREDSEVPFEAMRRTAAALPDATVTVQPDPGHPPSVLTAQQLFAHLAAR